MIRQALFITALLLLLLSPSMSRGADWEHLMRDNKGDSYFIDLESIRQTPSGTTRLLRKVEPGDTSKHSRIVSEMEIDCKEKRTRVLKETRLSDKGVSSSVNMDEKWQDVLPEDMNELLLEIVCSLRKTRSRP